MVSLKAYRTLASLVPQVLKATLHVRDFLLHGTHRVFVLSNAKSGGGVSEHELFLFAVHSIAQILKFDHVQTLYARLGGCHIQDVARRVYSEATAFLNVLGWPRGVH